MAGCWPRARRSRQAGAAAAAAAAAAEEADGALVFFDTSSASLEPVLHLPVARGASAVALCWQPRTRQLVVGDSSGVLRVLYDPDVSQNGAMLVKGRPKKRPPLYAAAADGAAVLEGSILVPNALPLYRTTEDEAVPGAKRKRLSKEEERRAKKQHMVPERPLNGPGMDGRVSGGGRSFTATFLKQHTKYSTRDEDPRLAILGMADKAAAEPVLVGRAYAATQPTPILAAKTLEQELEEAERARNELARD
jgi:hypothetical protein